MSSELVSLSFAPLILVASGAADARVPRASPVQDVGARFTVQSIAACLARQGVGVSSSPEHVVTGAAREGIDAGAAEEYVVAVGADDHIVSVLPDDHVVPTASVHGVVAGAGEDDLVGCRAGDVVVAGRAAHRARDLAARERGDFLRGERTVVQSDPRHRAARVLVTVRGPVVLEERPLKGTVDRSPRSRRRVAVASLMAAVFATLPSTPATAGSPPEGRLGVGDSIMLSAKPELRPLGYGVNASVGRQFGAGVWIVRRKAEDGTLPKRVIVHLGTNGTIDPGDCDRLVGYAGPKRRVFLVTITVPRAWEEPNNETLNACANAHDKVHVIRWWSKSHYHHEWFADDGFHLNAAGRAVYVRFVDRKVDDVLAELRAAAAR